MGITWANSSFPLSVIFHLSESVTEFPSPSPSSFTLPLKCPVASVQIKVEISSGWTLFPIVIVYYCLKSVLTTLPGVSFVTFDGGQPQLWRKESWDNPKELTLQRPRLTLRISGEACPPQVRVPLPELARPTHETNLTPFRVMNLTL